MSAQSVSKKSECKQMASAITPAESESDLKKFTSQ